MLPRTILPIFAATAVLLLGEARFPARRMTAAEPALAKGAVQKFRAACVKVDVTPEQPQWLQGYGPRQSEGVHDRIYHRIVAMDDGKTQFFLVATDICTITPSFYDDFCKELQDQTGIKAEQVWWATTHTHSAPELGSSRLAKLFAGTLGDRFSHEPNVEYSKWIKDVLIEGIKRARARLEPARLGVGTGASMANINRRGRNADGKSILGVDPAGPVDRQVGLIRLERPDGEPIALIANYAIHGTVLGPRNRLISGDVAGIVAEYVESKIGAPMLLINGAEGNVAPIYSVRAAFDHSHIGEFNYLLGNSILSANESIRSTTPDVTLALGKTIIETPRKAGLGWPKELADYARVTTAGAKLVRVPISFLEINKDTILWAAPLELFCEIAMDVRRASPFQYTFYYGLTNGSLLYLPTKQAFAEGGYEPAVSPFTAQAEQDFTSGVIQAMQDLARP